MIPRSKVGWLGRDGNPFEYSFELKGSTEKPGGPLCGGRQRASSSEQEQPVGCGSLGAGD